MSDNNPYILVLGASIVDIFGFCGRSYAQRDSIPGHIKISFGGVCRNISENLARVGVNTQFISTLGDDEHGKSILEHSRKYCYNMENSLFLEGENTPTYLAILNHQGEMESAVVDMESLNKMDEEFINGKHEVFLNAEYTIVDSDNPTLLEYILKKYEGKSKFILDPVSAKKARKIRHLIKYFHTIKPNRFETEALCGFKIETDNDLRKAGRFFIEQGVKNVFISLDADGIYYITSEGEEGKLACCEKIDVKNVTGAGDSFVAGIGYGYMNNLNIKDTLKYSVAMSIITITHEETINPKMSHELVKDLINRTKWREN